MHTYTIVEAPDLDGNNQRQEKEKIKWQRTKPWETLILEKLRDRTYKGEGERGK